MVDEMSVRERVRAVLDGDMPDRIPQLIYANFLPRVSANLLRGREKIMLVRVEAVLNNPKVKASAPLTSLAYRKVKDIIIPIIKEPRQLTTIHAFNPSLSLKTSFMSWRKDPPSSSLGTGGTFSSLE